MDSYCSDLHQVQNTCRLSIIIVNYKSQVFLHQCLTSIYQKVKGVDFEVVVVDNASNDNGLQKIKENFLKVKLIINTVNLGFSMACNQVLREVESQYVLLLNPDTEILDSNLEKMIGFLEENSRVGVLGSKILDDKGDEQRTAFPKRTVLREILDIIPYMKLERILPVNWTDRFYDKLIKESEDPFEVFWVTGACLLMRKKVLDEVGFLDENLFLFSEDVDFCWRAKKGHWKVMFFPLFRIVHNLGGSSLEDTGSLYLRLFHSYARRVYFGHKYYSRLGNFLIRIVMFIDLLTRLAYIKFRFDKDSSIERKKAKVKAYREALRAVIF
jgi:GT2 family glycosyltransferase